MKSDKDIEMYFVGFDFSVTEQPTLLVGKYDGAKVRPVKYISDKALVDSLHEKLTKPATSNSQEKQSLGH